jgi:hypothetical protein
VAADDAVDVGWFSREEFERLGLATETAEVIRLGFERASVN